MSIDRIHRAVSADGTEIAGRVVGQGPPLALLHGALYCGETAWEAMLPHLTRRFTCFLPSTRGRGLSADGEEHSPSRWLEDVVAFVDSIGQPVALFGWSGGAVMALGAAGQTDAVSAVVAYEPGPFEVIDEETFNAFTDTIARMTAEVEQGRPADAARLFSSLVCNDEEFAAVIAAARHEVVAPNVPADLRLYANLVGSTGPSLTDPARLATIAVPVLLLQGDRTSRSWFERGVRYVADNVPDARIRTIPGAGHGAPRHAPDAVAAEIVRFLEMTREPVRLA